MIGNGPARKCKNFQKKADLQRSTPIYTDLQLNPAKTLGCQQCHLFVINGHQVMSSFLEILGSPAFFLSKTTSVSVVRETFRVGSSGSFYAGEQKRPNDCLASFGLPLLVLVPPMKTAAIAGTRVAPSDMDSLEAAATMEKVGEDTPAAEAAQSQDEADETDHRKNDQRQSPAQHGEEQKSTAAAAPPAPAAPPAATKPPPENAVEGAKKEVQDMMDHHELDENDASALQKVFKENEALKEKVAKLKALLGRSGESQSIVCWENCTVGGI